MSIHSKQILLNTSGSAAAEVYEFIINKSVSDPTSAITYAGANANYTPASFNFSTGAINYGSWGDAFFNRLIRPVMLTYAGTVDYELNHDNFTKTINGASSDVSNSSFGGSCMIGFPQIWMKFVNDDSNRQHVYIANYQADEYYRCYTHQNKNGAWLDEIYINAFEPCNISSKLKSLADQTILVSTAGTTMLTYAQNNGSSWCMMDWGEIMMLQMLSILMFKSLDSQTKMGAGVVGGTQMTASGSLKNKPMFYATNNTSSSNVANKVFGIENLWGNNFKWILGLQTTGNTIKYKLCDYTTDGSTVTGFNDSANGYKTLATISSTIGGQEIKSMYLQSDCLLPSPNASDYVSNSSYNTYFCDYGRYYSNSSTNKVARFGGHYYNGAAAGLFYVTVYDALSYSYSAYAASLSCKPL